MQKAIKRWCVLNVGAMVSVSAMKTLTNYMYNKKIPFSIATIPRYVDALGVYNGNIPQTVPLSQATNLKTSLNYALARGARLSCMATHTSTAICAINIPA